MKLQFLNVKSSFTKLLNKDLGDSKLNFSIFIRWIDGIVFNCKQKSNEKNESNNLHWTISSNQFKYYGLLGRGCRRINEIQFQIKYVAFRAFNFNCLDYFPDTKEKEQNSQVENSSCIGF
jgi:hypothetical protein